MTSAQRTGQRAEEGGYSLIELLVAMVITLIVSGAIYGLLTSGQNAFRREPEVADRQQNIRIAMDLISKDIANAGTGMPLVGQVFTHTDAPAGGPNPTGAGAPYLNGAGPQGVMGVAGESQRGAPPTGTGADTSDSSDILEILSADETCPVYTVCLPAGLNGTAVPGVWTREAVPNPNTCMLPPGSLNSQGLVLLTDNRIFTLQPATLLANGTGCGGGAGTNGQMSLSAALPEWPTPGGVALTGNPPIQAFLYAGKVVRYLIAPTVDTAATTMMETAGTPALWRSETGRYDIATGILYAQPVLGSIGPWQLVARGIEDLQVEYMNGGGLWSNNPGIVNPCPAAPLACSAADYNNVIRRVRVTLSARALAPLLQGQTAPAGGAAPNAVRGQLVSIVTPRSAMLGLQAASQVSLWP
jgi:prepilin-type N-terminal cleavage/methylation domain-containing protein